MPHENETRTINGQIATPDTLGPTHPLGGGWVTPDGNVWWFCSGKYCKGLPWRASASPHPVSCATDQNTEQDKVSAGDVA